MSPELEHCQHIVSNPTWWILQGRKTQGSLSVRAKVHAKNRATGKLPMRHIQELMLLTKEKIKIHTQIIRRLLFANTLLSYSEFSEGKEPKVKIPSKEFSPPIAYWKPADNKNLNLMINCDALLHWAYILLIFSLKQYLLSSSKSMSAWGIRKKKVIL